MSGLSTRSHDPTPLSDVQRELSALAACPLCHTVAGSLTVRALDAGGEWECSRCGQHWDAARLATGAAYDAWVVQHGTSR